MRAGQVFVNEWFAGGVETPFGGYGKSGYGREKVGKLCGIIYKLKILQSESAKVLLDELKR